MGPRPSKVGLDGPGNSFHPNIPQGNEQTPLLRSQGNVDDDTVAGVCFSAEFAERGASSGGDDASLMRRGGDGRDASTNNNNIDCDPFDRHVDEELQIDHDGCFPPHRVHEVCPVNPCVNLPTYRTIHTIRKDIIKAIEDPYSLEQLRDPRMNIGIIRPLVDKCYENQDLSMVYCLLINRTQFQREQVSQGHHQNVCHTRALLCEIVANRVLRRFVEDNPGPQGLLLLSQILVGGFDPFQGAPAEVIEENSNISWTFQTRNGKKQRLPALELAIISESKIFLSSAACQKVVSAIYEGRVIYTPSSFMDILPDHYKQKPLTLYNPRKAPLLNQYRLIVPRTRAFLEVIHFIILLTLYLLVMDERSPKVFEAKELVFVIYTLSWILDQFASILEHGWQVYTMNLWSFLDVTFACIFFVYLGLRYRGQQTADARLGTQAIDVLAMGAPVLIPRLAFNLMSENMLFVSLRAMMRDFFVLTVLAVWCFVGFLLSMFWLGGGTHEPVTISKWMLWVWFGLDGTGIQRSTEFHKILGPILMVTFAFLGNTLFLTILVSMLSTTFAGIVSNATAEIQFRRAILTFEGVKSDAIFAYQPPFNLLALAILLPLKFVLTPRWFHKTNVFAQRVVNAPLLFTISCIERQILWSGNRRQREVEPFHRSQSRAALWNFSRGWSVHGDINRVFESLPPDEEESEGDSDEAVVSDIEEELTMGQHILPTHQAPGSESPNHFDKAFGKASEAHADENDMKNGPESPKLSRTGTFKSRRDSVVPWTVNESNVIDDIGVIGEEMEKRLEKLEGGVRRIEKLLLKLLEGKDGV